MLEIDYIVEAQPKPVVKVGQIRKNDVTGRIVLICRLHGELTTFTTIVLKSGVDGDSVTPFSVFAGEYSAEEVIKYYPQLLKSKMTIYE